MEFNFDVLDKEFEQYNDSMLTQKQVSSIFEKLKIKNDIGIQTVLLVDDAMFMRHVIKNILTENGFFVIAEASDGITAVQMYKQYKPDLVLMNLTMPVMDGIMATKVISGLDTQARVVMLSGISNYKTVKESILAGACGFIAGSFDRDKFLNSINV